MSRLARAPALTRIDVQPARQLENLAGLEGLPSLASVIISDSALSDLSALSGSTSLEAAEFIHAFIEDLSPLGTCENLQRLRLSGNQIVDLAPLGLLDLDQLTIDQNQIVDLTPLSGAPLSFLDISENPLGSLDPIGTLEELVSLAMRDVGATSLDFLAGYELTSLVASTNQIEDVSVLVGMPLRTLDLTANDIATLPSDFVGTSGTCSETLLEQNPLDAPSKDLLETRCNGTEEVSYRWDGGGCGNCFILK